MGQFKFKFTDADGVQKTIKSRLSRLLIEGIQVHRCLASEYFLKLSVMLIDYVIYLSIRGQTERKLIEAAYDIASESGDSVDNPSKLLVRFDDDQFVTEDIEIVKELVASVVLPWANQGTGVVQRTIEQAPSGWDSDNSIELGRKLFFQSKANCYSCHGQTALGDGQTNLFDNWTLEHLGNEPGETIGSGEDGEMAGIPEYFHQQELASIGVVRPRNIRPRNLRLGNYRGGRRPIDIYQRITGGIEGSRCRQILS